MRQMNVKNEIKIDIPAEVGTLIDELNAAGFEAFAVGGCVRDSIMGKVPRDWDICTSAKPYDMLDRHDPPAPSVEARPT